MKIIYTPKIVSCVLLLVSILFSCEEFIEIDPPRTDLVRQTVFADDETANAAVIDLYYQMSNNGFASGDLNSISFLGALSSDELANGVTFTTDYAQFNQNEILTTNPRILSLWSELYKCIYKSNAIIEGLTSSSGITDSLKRQLEGEAKFIRAFCHFYLLNLWGEIPLVLTTDRAVNQNIGRTDELEIYSQIVADLVIARDLLPNDFSFSGGERVRVNKNAAIALLARVYLYMEEWDKAESQATLVIESSSLYDLTELSNTFLKNNSEAIWQLLPGRWGYAWDVEASLFYGHKITSQLSDSFEADDERKSTWLGSTLLPYTYAFKYKDYIGTSIEYSVVLRLAEQYLIRAEARTKQDNISGAQNDINAIRNRAGLGNTSANDQASLLSAIEQERRVEFFTEWAHRWLDLKRWSKAHERFSPIKGITWQTTDQLYPIPEAQILNDPSMRGKQNPGY